MIQRYNVSIGTTEHAMADKNIAGQTPTNSHLKEKKAGDLQITDSGLLETPRSDADDEGFIPVNSKKSKKNKNGSSSPTSNNSRNQQQKQGQPSTNNVAPFTAKSTKGKKRRTVALL